MKRTYTGTLFHPVDLNKAKVILDVYNGLKGVDDDPLTVELTGLVAWDIIEGGAEAEEIERDTDTIDEYHEYLVLHFENGETSTYRNSHVAMFIF